MPKYSVHFYDLEDIDINYQLFFVYQYLNIHENISYPIAIPNSVQFIEQKTQNARCVPGNTLSRQLTKKLCTLRLL